MAIEYKLDLSRQYFVNQVLINACHLRNPDLSYMRNDINSLCYTFIFCFTYNLSIQSHSDRWVYRVFSFNLCLLVEMFNVKEEKILLQGQEGGDDEMINALKQIVSNCTFNKVDINKLPSFDIEYIFLQIRAKSVGEKIKLNVPFLVIFAFNSFSSKIFIILQCVQI